MTVSGAGSYATAAYTPARPGSYRWKTTYGGDADNLAGSGPAASRGSTC